MTVYLEKMAEFSALLRQEGLAVGPQDTADACQILSWLDLRDRETVKAALQAVYARSREEQSVFQRAFDGFFVSVEKREALRRKHAAEAEELARRREAAEQELQVNGQPMNLREDLQDVYIRMGGRSREQLQQLLEKTRGNLERSPQLYGNFIRSVFMRFLLEQQMVLEDAAAGCEETDPDLALLYRDISRFQDADIPRAAALIAAISRQIDAGLSRQKRGVSRSGKLDFRRTIRKSLETGGSFRRLEYRRKRRRKRRLVLLCDVSGSMLQFSEFALRFILSMSQVSESSQTYLFSEGIHRVDPFALRNMDSFRDYVRASGLYGRGTDLGAALEWLCHSRPAALGPSTTLLLLSDTKTVGLPRAAQALREARQMAGKTLWLNPIPERKWPYVQSIQVMRSVCPMVPCGTLDEMARACRRLLK